MAEHAIIHVIAMFNEHANAGFEYRYRGTTNATMATDFSGEVLITFNSSIGAPVARANPGPGGYCQSAGINVFLRNSAGNLRPWTRERDNPGGGGTQWLDSTLAHELGHASGFVLHPWEFSPPQTDWDSVTAATFDRNEDSFLYDRDIDRLRDWNGPTARHSFYLRSTGPKAIDWPPFPNVISSFGAPTMITSIGPAVADRYTAQNPALVLASVANAPHFLQGDGSFSGWDLLAGANPSANARRAVSVAVAPSGQIMATWLGECQRCAALTNPPAAGACDASLNPPLFCAIGWAWSQNNGASWVQGQIVNIAGSGGGTNGRVSVEYDPGNDRFVAFFVDPNNDSLMSTHSQVSFPPNWSAPALALDSSSQPGIRQVCGSVFDSLGNGLFVGTNSRVGSSPQSCVSSADCGGLVPCTLGICGGADNTNNLDRIFTYDVDFDATSNAYLLRPTGGSIGRDFPRQDITARSCGVGYNPDEDLVIIAYTDPFNRELMLTDRTGLTAADPEGWRTPFSILSFVDGSVDIAYLSGPGYWMVTFAHPL